VWGHYFPNGKARTDVKVAGRQAAKCRAAMVDYDSMKLEVKAAEEATEAAEKRWQEAMDERNTANTEMRQAKDMLAARADAHAEEIERLTERLHEAQERVFDLTPASGGSILNRV
jgi:chromosome segregation ATPase